MIVREFVLNTTWRVKERDRTLRYWFLNTDMPANYPSSRFEASLLPWIIKINRHQNKSGTKQGHGTEGKRRL